MAISRTGWKVDERELAKWAGGSRHSSNGKVQQDLSGPWWTAEHKSFSALPARLVKAFDQAKENAKLEPDKVPYVFFTLHAKRGIRNRRFVCVEVDLKQDDFKDVASSIIIAAVASGSTCVLPQAEADNVRTVA